MRLLGENSIKTAILPYWIFSIFLVVVTAKIDPVQIENKNINVNYVNINAKEIAKELWKIISMHLKDNKNSVTRRLLQEDAVNELEQVIRRVVEPTRRLNPITEFELAKNYEKIVRRAIPILRWNQSPPESNVNVDNVVDDMMWATETLINQPSKTSPNKYEPINDQHSVTDTGDETWSFTLRQIMKSLKNIENSMQNCRNRQAVDSNYDLYDCYRNDASDSADFVDDLHGPNAKVNRALQRRKACGYELSKQEGIQDEIPKREIAFPSTVRRSKNNPKNKNNFLSFEKLSDKRLTTKY